MTFRYVCLTRTQEDEFFLKLQLTAQRLQHQAQLSSILLVAPVKLQWNNSILQ